MHESSRWFSTWAQESTRIDAYPPMGLLLSLPIAASPSTSVSASRADLPTTSVQAQRQRHIYRDVRTPPAYKVNSGVGEGHIPALRYQPGTWPRWAAAGLNLGHNTSKTRGLAML